MAAVAELVLCPASSCLISTTVPSPTMFPRNRSSAPPKDAPCLQDKVQASYQKIFLNLACLSSQSAPAKTLPGCCLPGRAALVFWKPLTCNPPALSSGCSLLLEWSFPLPSLLGGWLLCSGPSSNAFYSPKPFLSQYT